MILNGRARVSSRNPEAKGVCDRCGFMYSLADLDFDYQWAGLKLQNLQIKVCRTCSDIPQEQFRAFTIPADPVPVRNPRTEYYAIEVNNFLQSQDGPSLLTETGQAILWEINVTPNADPNLPVLIP